MVSHSNATTQNGARRMILATAAGGLPQTLGTTSFHSLSAMEAFSAFHAAGLWIGPRDELEEKPSFRQIIPYVVLRVGNRVVRYTRTSAGGEGRLHGRMSIGLGGHIDLPDVISTESCVDLAATLESAAQRELDEELGDVDCVAKEWVGVLVDNETPVGRVHIGVVGVWTLRTAPGSTSEDAVGEVSLCSFDDLYGSKHRLETWSALLLDYVRDVIGKSECEGRIPAGPINQ